MNALTRGLGAVLLVAGLAGCATHTARWARTDARAQNEYLLRQHFEACAARGEAFPVFSLGEREVDAQLQTHADVRAARETFLRANADLDHVLDRDERYRAIQDWFNHLPPSERKLERLQQRNQAEVFARLALTSPEYRATRERRDDALRVSNGLIFEQILLDARTEGRILPTAWIGQKNIDRYIARF